jgi:hypothetical protein
VGWVVLTVYIVGYLGLTVTIARFLASSSPFDGDLDAMDRVLVIALAMMIAPFWPLVIPGGYFYKKVFGGQR